MNGTCKLCGKERELCKISHIIPDFMYKGLFDEIHRMHVIQSKSGAIEQKGHRQTGEFDSNLLCQDCDNNTLGKLDRYASLILYDGHQKIVETRTDPDGMKYTYCAEIDYRQFKLFLLSILWRASISKRPMFQEVNLGPHEAHIRCMLFEDSPGNQLKYPCLIMTYNHLDGVPVDVVLQPSLSRVNKGYVYKFLIGGMVYIYYVSEHIEPKEKLKSFVISENNELKIIHLSPLGAKRILRNMLGVRID